MKDMLGTLVRKIVDLPLDVIRVLCDLVEKLSGEAGQQWLAELKNFLRKENCWTGVVVETILRLISIGESLVLDAADGKEILAKAKDVFAYIDPDFKNWGADEPGSATGEMPVAVYEMTQDGTFAHIFGSLNADVYKLCFTQAQIKAFVKKHRRWLRTDGYGTFFLFRSHGEVFVADVNFISGASLRVHVYRFGYDYVWNVAYRPRVVVPQLA
ncbi:MAG: hypothetical protein P4L62_01740 [Candidatus Pacebacteria bacterium]|nr:hypothetical protein [Candidatus Paceibacterota bacterium]MDR3583058.1 hypothetical protein [Candidatus Paceibacterota bacterium]